MLVRGVTFGEPTETRWEPIHDLLACLVGLRRPLELRVLKSTRNGITAEVLRTKPAPVTDPSAAGAGDFVPESDPLMDVVAQKRELRRQVVAHILALSPEQRSAQEADLVARFDGLPGLARATTVLLYVTAFPEEIQTRPMLDRVLGRGQALVCPRVDRRERRLRLFAVGDLDTDLVAGTLGIPEPRKTLPEVDPRAIDWVLVPGLAFDPRGYRLGRGAGHYDKLLPALRPEVPCWAFCLDPQWVEELPVEPHDVPLDGVVSPSRTECRGGFVR